MSKEDKKNLKLLQQLLQENPDCADCKAKGPKWASPNLGVFLCIRCAGLHRKMGTHISKIKSVSLDTWKTPELEFMKEHGNRKVNQQLLVNAPLEPPIEDDL